MEGVYLVHTREFITADIPIYKIGRSYNIENRTKQYPRGSNVLFMIMCKNSIECENYLIQLFKTKFIQKTYYGREYFEGDKILMIREIFKYIDNKDNNVNNSIISNNINIDDIIVNDIITNDITVNDITVNDITVNNITVNDIIVNDIIVNNIIDFNEFINDNSNNNNITIHTINALGCEHIDDITTNQFRSLFTNNCNNHYKIAYKLSCLIYKNKNNMNFTKHNMNKNIITYLSRDMEVKDVSEEEFYKIFLNNIKKLCIELFCIHKANISLDDLITYMQGFLLCFGD